jgi:hypothetical protein
LIIKAFSGIINLKDTAFGRTIMADEGVKDEINLDTLNTRLDKLYELEDGVRLENLINIEADFASLQSEDTPERREFKRKLEKIRKEMSPNDNGNEGQENSERNPHPGQWEALNNREKREQVVFELRNGFLQEDFVGGIGPNGGAKKDANASHREYLYEQIAQGNLVLNSDQDKESVKQLLGSEKGLEEFRKKYVEQIFKDRAVSMQVVPGATTGGIVTPEMMKVYDFGLSKAATSYQSGKVKDKAYDLIAKAQKSAIDYKYYGGDTYNKVIDDLRQERANTSKWRVLRQHRLAKAEQNLDPAYWDTKVVHANVVMLPYYKARAYLKNRSSNKAAKTFSPKYFQKMERAIKIRAEEKSYKWLSRDVGKKIKARWQIMFSRSPENLAKKMAKRGNITQLQDYLQDWQIAAKRSRAADRQENSMNPQSAKKYEYEASIYEKIDSMLGDRIDELTGKEKAEQKAVTSKAENIELKPFDKVVDKLREHVEFVKKTYASEIENDPKMKVFRQVYGDNLPENGANYADEIITNKAVLEAMSKAMGYKDIDEMLGKMGINDKNDLATIKEKLFKGDEKTGGNTRGNTGNETSEQPNPEVNENPETLEDEEKKQTTVGGNGRVEGKGNLEDVACPDGWKHELRVDENKSRYDLITEDKDGKKREPTAEEIQALVARLQKDGIKEVNLEKGDWSVETLDKVNNAFKEAGIGVKNQKEVDEIIKQNQSQTLESNENPTPEVGGNSDQKPVEQSEQQTPVENGSHSGEPQQPQTQNGDKPNEQQPAENGDKNIGMAQVLQSISKTEDLEKMKKQLEIANQIAEGKFDKTGEKYLDFITSVHKAFGDTKETKYLCDTAAAKALEADVQDIKDGAQKSGDKPWTSEDSQWLKKEIHDEKAKVRADTGQKVTQLSQIEELAKDSKADLKGYPKYIQQAVTNMRAIDEATKDSKNPLKPEHATILKGRVMSQAMQGRQRSMVEKGKLNQNARQMAVQDYVKLKGKGRE